MVEPDKYINNIKTRVNDSSWQYNPMKYTQHTHDLHKDVGMKFQGNKRCKSSCNTQ